MEATKHLSPFSKLGEILLSNGIVSEDQLKKSLENKNSPKSRLERF